MIPKHIPRKPENDNYRALALYAADAKINGDKGEKTLMSWHEGSMAEDYRTGIIEVEATQAMNTRTKKEKTYHLMVSFRPEDEAKLTPEIFKDIEKTLAETLGFSEHQRHCGVHKNTDNIHIHIAYNMINPRSFNRHAPFYDHQKLHKACRELEKKYGLKTDKGIEKNEPKKTPKTNIKAQAYEAHHGQESFNSFVLKRREKILETVQRSENWRDVHESFLKMGLEIKLSGNGLTIKDRFGKHKVRPSDVDRDLSKSQLEKKFGSFIGVSKEMLSTVKADEKYNALPLHQDAGRGDLYALFLAEMEQRKAALDAIKKQEEDAFKVNKERWEEKRKRILGKYALLPADRRRLMQEIKVREEAELAGNRLALAEKRKSIRESRPYTSWTKFLQHQAALGNETALEVLRSKKLKPELLTVDSKDKISEKLMAIKESKELQAKILQTRGLNQNHRRALLTVAKMREVMAREPGFKADELKYSIDTKGTVIFSLKSGGTIRDTGQEIHFSGHDKNARLLADNLARAKWGRNITADGSVLHRLNDRNQSLGR